jgi:hypothetical protein
VRLGDSFTFKSCRQWLKDLPPQSKSHCLWCTCSLLQTSSLLYWFFNYALPLFNSSHSLPFSLLSPSTGILCDVHISTCSSARIVPPTIRIFFCHVCRSHKCSSSLIEGRQKKKASENLSHLREVKKKLLHQSRVTWFAPWLCNLFQRFKDIQVRV